MEIVIFIAVKLDQLVKSDEVGWQNNSSVNVFTALRC